MHSKSDSVLVYLLGLTFYTSCITISFKRESTRTSLSMIASCTISSQGTVSWITKWLTFFSCETTTRDKATLFISSTVSILTASSFNTCHKRITLKSRRTCTNWSVIIYITNCSRSTSSWQAWIYTFLWFASFVKRTVFVYQAFIYVMKSNN